MKKKALAFAAMACSVAMLLSACGGSNSNAASGDTAGSTSSLRTTPNRRTR